MEIGEGLLSYVGEPAQNGSGIAYKGQSSLGDSMAFPAPVAHSKGRINRAGESMRGKNVPPAEDFTVINDWRASHSYILNTFQAMHRNRTRETSIVVAQRLKRLRTIFHKLRRQPKMELARMDDIAGCRLIFQSNAELYDYRTKFLQSRHNHVRRNKDDKYDYIKRPKPSGYRGVHDVYEYNVGSKYGKKYNGLLLELQYRTIYQHAWATSVEVVGLITEHQPKFGVSDKDHEEYFKLSSEIIARVYENEKSCYPNMQNEELVASFEKLEKKIALTHKLKLLNVANKHIQAARNVILVFRPDGRLDVMSFRRPGEALVRYFELEKEPNGADIVLVRADTEEDIRNAFRNYFSDTVEFVSFIEDGLTVLRDRI